ncbi:hypothetical protein D3C86_1630330 [compost metagenome]
MCGFDHFDFFARCAVTVTGHHQAADFTLPAALDHLGHGGCGFAGADDDHATAAVGRQMGFEDLLRMRRVDGCGKQLAQQLLRIDRHGGLPEFLLFERATLIPVGVSLLAIQALRCIRYTAVISSRAGSLLQV